MTELRRPKPTARATKKPSAQQAAPPCPKPTVTASKHKIGIPAASAIGLVAIALLCLQCTIGNWVTSSSFTWSQVPQKDGTWATVWSDNRVTPQIVSRVTPSQKLHGEAVSESRDRQFDKAVTAINSGNWLDAEESLSRVISGPNPPTLALYLQGFTLKRLDRKPAATTAYESYLALSPTSKYRYSAAIELAYLLLPEVQGAKKAEEIAGPVLSSYNAIADPEIRPLAIQALKSIYRGRAIEETRIGNQSSAVEYKQKVEKLKAER
jgi:hypothetical protein